MDFSFKNLDRAMGGFIEGVNRNSSKNLERANRNASRNLERANRGASKSLGLEMRNERKSVSAKLRMRVLEKCNYRCRGCGEDDEGLLEIHHVDMNNTHTYLSNLISLCPTCHAKRHKRVFRKKYYSEGLLGKRVTTTRLVRKREKKHNRKRRKRRTSNQFYPFLSSRLGGL